MGEHFSDSSSAVHGENFSALSHGDNGELPKLFPGEDGWTPAVEIQIIDLGYLAPKAAHLVPEMPSAAYSSSSRRRISTAAVATSTRSRMVRAALLISELTFCRPGEIRQADCR